VIDAPLAGVLRELTFDGMREWTVPGVLQLDTGPGLGKHYGCGENQHEQSHHTNHSTSQRETHQPTFPLCENQTRWQDR
jgi:hypothetical protein